VYWLPPAPYLRWAAAAALLLGALAWDLRPVATETLPFAARSLQAGEAIDAGAVSWRAVPAGLFTAPDLSAATAANDLAAGDPLTPSVLGTAAVVPAGWWEVPVAVGSHARAGDVVMLVVTDPPTTITGLVVSAQQGDPYSLDYRPAVLAVPGESAALVATAAASGALVAAVAP
jgi:hypothetical protein